MARKRKNGEGTWGEKTVNGKTYRFYRDAVNTRLINFSEYDITNVEMSALSDAMIQSYLNALADKYSLNSIKKTYGLIKNVYVMPRSKKTLQLVKTFSSPLFGFSPFSML